MSQPNVLFIMTDQQRFDTIAALGNGSIQTPNLDRLVHRGVSFRRAYSTCPVCVPARYTIRTGCEPPTTGSFQNGWPQVMPGQAQSMQERCGPYLPRVMRSTGYRTFGVGKFHTIPWDEDLGYEVQLHSEEMYLDQDQRTRDAYHAWLEEHYPDYARIEQLHGERSEMYYMPQMSPLQADVRRDELVCLTDLFAIATGVAGRAEVRDGCDVLGVLDGQAAPRQRLVGYHGKPGSPQFKMMVIEGDWKYIYLANGGREQLFNLRDDPHELALRLSEQRAVADRLRTAAVETLRQPGSAAALTDHGLRAFPFEARPLRRLLQMDTSRGIRDYGVPAS